jgi:hypothetical protein
MIKDNPDLKKMKTFIEKKHQFAAQLEIEKINNILTIKKVLTERQFQKWKALERARMDFERRERMEIEKETIEREAAMRTRREREKRETEEENRDESRWDD